MKKMNDPIERQDAIDAASYECDELRGVFGRIEERLKALPPAQPEYRLDEWCTDCKEYDHERHCCPRWNRVIRTTLQDVQAKGKWIKMSDTDGFYWSCNVCGYELPRITHFDPQFDIFPRLESIPKTNYCPNCGAKMEVVE